MGKGQTLIAVAFLLVVALAPSWARGQAAQPSPAGQSVTAIGCISPAVHDGSLGGSPGVPPATPASAPTLANTAQPTGAFLLNSATPPDASDADRQHAAAGHSVTNDGVTYELEGAQADLEKHSGDLVEVTGVFSERSRGAAPETRAPVKHLEVSSVKVLAAKCPTASKK